MSPPNAERRPARPQGGEEFSDSDEANKANSTAPPAVPAVVFTAPDIASVEDDGPDLDHALILAKRLMALGGKPFIREVLTDFSSSRVSELQGEDIAAFVELVEDEIGRLESESDDFDEWLRAQPKSRDNAHILDRQVKKRPSTKAERRRSSEERRLDNIRLRTFATPPTQVIGGGVAHWRCMACDRLWPITNQLGARAHNEEFGCSGELVRLPKRYVCKKCGLPKPTRNVCPGCKIEAVIGAADTNTKVIKTVMRAPRAGLAVTE